MSIVKDLIEGGAEAVKKLEAEESDTLDYKSAFDANNKEFGKDVSAFANSEGGVLIYGVKEEGGKPVGFPGVDISHDILVAKENVIETSISPPLHVKLKTVELPDAPGTGFVIADIPYSLDRPHMLTIRGDNRYYHRQGRRSVPMSDYEVAAAFSVRKTSIEEVQSTAINIVSEIIPQYQDRPFIYIIGCPVPPIIGVLPVFDRKLVKPLYNLIHEFTGTTSGTAHMHFVEYGFPEYGYVRTYSNGCIFCTLVVWRDGSGDRFLAYNEFYAMLDKYVRLFFNVYDHIGKSRLNVLFRLGTENCTGIYLDKLSFMVPDKRFMRPLTSDIVLDNPTSLVTVGEDLDGFIESMLAPVRREFGF